MLRGWRDWAGHMPTLARSHTSRLQQKISEVAVLRCSVLGSFLVTPDPVWPPYRNSSIPPRLAFRETLPCVWKARAYGRWNPPPRSPLLHVEEHSSVVCMEHRSVRCRCAAITHLCISFATGGKGSHGARGRPVRRSGSSPPPLRHVLPPVPWSANSAPNSPLPSHPPSAELCRTSFDSFAMCMYAGFPKWFRDVSFYHTCGSRLGVFEAPPPGSTV